MKVPHKVANDEVAEDANDNEWDASTVVIDSISYAVWTIGNGGRVKSVNDWRRDEYIFGFYREGSSLPTDSKIQRRLPRRILRVIVINVMIKNNFRDFLRL